MEYAAVCGFGSLQKIELKKYVSVSGGLGKFGVGWSVNLKMKKYLAWHTTFVLNGYIHTTTDVNKIRNYVKRGQGT